MKNTQLFTQRRSVNFFNPNKSISKELLSEIIDTAVTAPSAFNLQPWEIIAVTSDEGKKKLFDTAFNQPKILEAPVTLLIIGDYNGYNESNKAWDELKSMVGEEAVTGYIEFANNLYGSTPERKIKFAESNAGLLSMSIMYAAEALGVNSHAMSGIDFEGIKKAFAIGEGKEVVMAITLGYFDEEKQLYPQRKRFGFNEIVSFA
jgi:putative NAD(P)H nitroreductase